MTVLDVSRPALPARNALWLVSLYSATIFLSAALFFCIEPMFSKMVLPTLGGSAAVWSVAMVVFQGLLLAGYVYAHLLTRHLTLRHAAFVHVCVLTAAALFLPIGIAQSFGAPPKSGVSLWLIGLFLASVGMPCFALSASAPLLQAWFARTGPEHGQKAYLLYRASNLGSFAILIAYPFAVEPRLALSEQSHLWSIGYIALVFAIGACAMVAMRAPDAAPLAAPEPLHIAASWQRKFQWAALGFIPSGLLVAVTAHIATDVASGPFLWIMPLAIYLLTFVFAFTDKPVVSARLMLGVQPLTVAILAQLLLWTSKIDWGLSLAGHLAGFFVAAMVCQGQLYRLRPEPAQLTGFYAWMSLGGVLGGAFAALAAPHLFDRVLEYPILAFAALLVRPDLHSASRSVWVKDGAFVAIVAAVVAVPLLFLSAGVTYFIACVLGLGIVLALQWRHPVRVVGIAAVVLGAINLYEPSQDIIYRARSFYGVYKAVDVENGRYRVLYHGTTAHGAERIRDAAGRADHTRPVPLTYYHPGGALSDVIDAVRARDGGRIPHVALVGLGMGALSCRSVPGEGWTIYELDPLMVEIARNRRLFRSISMCAAHATIVVGDGRLLLRRATPDIDLLMLDTFSSDSVPVHMLTREAFALYRARLAPHGTLVVHISNAHMELENVVAAAAAQSGMVTAVKVDPDPAPGTLRLKAEVAVVTRSIDDLRALKLGSDWHIVAPAARPWSDDYSDIFGAMVAKWRER
jgi:hypothetical protein